MWQFPYSFIISSLGCFEIHKNAVRAWACSWRHFQRERFTCLQHVEMIDNCLSVQHFSSFFFCFFWRRMLHEMYLKHLSFYLYIETWKSNIRSIFLLISITFVFKRVLAFRKFFIKFIVALITISLSCQVWQLECGSSLPIL